MELGENLRIKFNPPLADREPTYVRDPGEVAKVLMDPNVQVAATYLGYRQIYLPEHKEIVEQNHLQYDLTIVPPIMLGNEFNKTVGHYHANKPGTDIAHPEYYEVLNGRGLFILQKMDGKFEQVIDVIIIEAKTGDQVMYPPNYGHNFVNLGLDVLVTANWLSTDYKPLYEPIAQRRGMAYYVIKKNGGYELVPNKHYSELPSPRMVESINNLSPMYGTAVTDPGKFDFLNNPEKYANMFTQWTQR